MCHKKVSQGVRSGYRHKKAIPPVVTTIFSKHDLMTNDSNYAYYELCKKISNFFTSLCKLCQDKVNNHRVLIFKTPNFIFRVFVLQYKRPTPLSKTIVRVKLINNQYFLLVIQWFYFLQVSQSITTVCCGNTSDVWEHTWISQKTEISVSETFRHHDQHQQRGEERTERMSISISISAMEL